MCLAIPGKIIAIEDKNVKVDYGSETRDAIIVEGNFKIGDYVIVQNKVVVERVEEEQVKGWLELVKNDGD